MSDKLKRGLTIAIAMAVAFVSVVRGIEMCFCDKDPDGCGEACHDCSHDHGSDENSCAHLKFDISDVATASSNCPATHLMTCVAPAPFIPVTAGYREEAVVPAQAPPDKPSDRFRHYSTRLFPRS